MTICEYCEFPVATDMAEHVAQYCPVARYQSFAKHEQDHAESPDPDCNHCVAAAERAQSNGSRS